MPHTEHSKYELADTELSKTKQSEYEQSSHNHSGHTGSHTRQPDAQQKKESQTPANKISSARRYSRGKKSKPQKKIGPSTLNWRQKKKLREKAEQKKLEDSMACSEGVDTEKKHEGLVARNEGADTERKSTCQEKKNETKNQRRSEAIQENHEDSTMPQERLKIKEIFETPSTDVLDGTDGTELDEQLFGSDIWFAAERLSHYKR